LADGVAPARGGVGPSRHRRFLRAWLPLGTPEGATVINGIGPYRLPVDISYPLGDGALLAHAGNDLAGFADPQRSTRHLAERLLDWLEGR